MIKKNEQLALQETGVTPMNKLNRSKLRHVNSLIIRDFKIGFLHLNHFISSKFKSKYNTLCFEN